MRRSRIQLRPLSQMYGRSMQHIAVPDRQAKRRAHREETHKGEEEMLRHPKFTKIEIFVGESTRREGGVVSVRD